MNEIVPTPSEKYDFPISDPLSIKNLKETLGTETASEIIKGFFELTQENIEKSLIDLEDKNYDAFEQSCHKIKSNVAYLGGIKLHEICNDIENFHVEQNFQAIDEIAEQFKECCEETVTELKKII